MPSLLAIISADANPMKRELQAVERMSERAGRNIRQNIEGGGHVGSSGVLRETVVLMRELSRGNLSRVPGSLSILLGQLGVLKLLVKDNASASKVLADAWTEQSAKAALAAASATRKAAASQAAFYADVEEKEETLAVAVADEEAAGKAILLAKATEEKAAAATVAAEAEAAEGAAAVASAGPLSILLGLVVAIGTAFYIWSKHIQSVADSMAGLQLPDLTPRDPSRMSAQEEGWKKIADSIRNAKDEYDSVSAAADRYEAALNDQHELEKKLLDIRIKQGKAKPSEILDLQKKHQKEDLQAMIRRRDALQADSVAKKKQADAIKASTTQDESENEHDLKKHADAARDHLFGKPNEKGKREGGVQQELHRYNGYTRTFGGFFSSLKNSPTDFWKYGMRSGNSVRKKLGGQVDEDYGVIERYNAFMRNKKPNAEKRDLQTHLYNQAAKSGAEAAELTEKIKDQPGINGRKNAILSAEIAGEQDAKKPSEKGQMIHGHVNDLQHVGAYTSRAVHTSSHQANTSAHVSAINTKMDKVVTLLGHKKESQAKTTASGAEKRIF